MRLVCHTYGITKKEIKNNKSNACGHSNKLADWLNYLTKYSKRFWKIKLDELLQTIQNAQQQMIIGMNGQSELIPKKISIQLFLWTVINCISNRADLFLEITKLDRNRPQQQQLTTDTHSQDHIDTNLDVIDFYSGGNWNSNFEIC